MRISLLGFGAIMALFLVDSALCASSQYQVVKPNPEAVTVAAKFLSVVDAGYYTETFAMFPARIRSGGDAFEKNWVSYLNVKRAPLGRMVSRKLVKAWFTKTLPGSPDGYYEFFHYDTSFLHKMQGAESVVLTKESGHWQVSAYRFK
jgi:hypothetical protein